MKLTVPLPVPLALPLVLIQLTLLVAVHPQPADAATENDPLPPAAPTDADAGESEYVHPDAAACVTVKVCPPAVIVPPRWLVDVLAATLNATVAVPVPLAALVMVIQLALLVVVQAHPVPAVSANELAPAADDIDCDVADSEYVQAVAPDWVTVNT